MKILEKGESWNFKYRCSCNSLLCVEEDDILAYGVENNTALDCYYSFYCPICGKRINIPEEKIPVNIQRKKLQKVSDEYWKYRSEWR